MRNISVILALALVAGASLSAQAAGKKDKKQGKKATTTVVKQPVALNTANDSLSYASGQALTRGMMDYVIAQLKVDTTYMADFIGGIREGLTGGVTSQQKAVEAGHRIANMVKEDMLPRMKADMGKMGVEIDSLLLTRGFVDAVENDTTVFTLDKAIGYQEKEIRGIQKRIADEKRAEGKAWLDANAKKEGVKVTPSGLQYRIIREGNGAVAANDEEVEVKYEGRLIDGTVFDSSYTRNPQTTSFRPSQVIKGWTEALKMMPEGSEWEVYIPQELAYGERQAGKIPPYSTLIFKLEVVKVKKDEKPAEDAKDGKKDNKKATKAKQTPKARK